LYFGKAGRREGGGSSEGRGANEAGKKEQRVAIQVTGVAERDMEIASLTGLLSQLPAGRSRTNSIFGKGKVLIFL